MKKTEKGFEIFRRNNLLEDGQYSKIPGKQKTSKLPETIRKQLSEIVIEAQKSKSFTKVGGDSKLTKNKKGMVVLFSGSSGTGKTMAANVLANNLELDLFRVDLSMVVNKYIGETEKNLEKIFGAGEQSRVILFFDEADALFGKRTEVKDSHDRFSKIDTSHIFERIEEYKGLAILATNIKENIDPTFMRRIQHILDFPKPNEEERISFWKRFFRKLFKRG